MSQDTPASDVIQMPELVVYFVDDQERDAERYRERLSRAEGFQCQLFPPPRFEKLADLVAKEPNLFLIDVELDRLQSDGTTKVAYGGLALAAEIRMRWPDCPIVLITRQSILNDLGPTTRRQVVDRTPSSDEMILKEDLDDDLDATRRLLISIAKGFQGLRSIGSKSWDSLAQAMGATEDESLVLREAAPPLQQGQWIVSEAAEWIRKVVLRFPGIVYDPIHAATRLGISLESFQDDRAQDLLVPARYTGVFAPTEGRWWKDRLLEMAMKLASEHGLNGPVNRSFSEVVSRTSDFKPSEAVCVWDPTSLADWVCYILRKPVKMKNSLRYYPDSRPSVMDNARVSFRAVRESPEFDEQLLDSEGRALFPDIVNQDDPINEYGVD